MISIRLALGALSAACASAAGFNALNDEDDRVVLDAMIQAATTFPAGAVSQTSSLTSAADTEAGLLRARSAPPMWAAHTQAERDAALASAIDGVRVRRDGQQRRQMQTQAQRDSDLGSLTIQRGWRRDASACDDTRAENAGADQPCSYDCATLQSFYFPDEDSRCFAYDVATGWPAGEHDRLHVLAGLGFHSVAVLQSYSA